MAYTVTAMSLSEGSGTAACLFEAPCNPAVLAGSSLASRSLRYVKSHRFSAARCAANRLSMRYERTTVVRFSSAPVTGLEGNEKNSRELATAGILGRRE